TAPAAAASRELTYRDAGMRLDVHVVFAWNGDPQEQDVPVARGQELRAVLERGVCPRIRVLDIEDSPRPTAADTLGSRHHVRLCAMNRSSSPSRHPGVPSRIAAKS